MHENVKENDDDNYGKKLFFLLFIYFGKCKMELIGRKVAWKRGRDKRGGGGKYFENVRKCFFFFCSFALVVSRSN